jgi:hypothetical protein
MHTTLIPETQCIGDSLETINTNFTNLDTEAVRLENDKVSKAGGTMTGALTLPGVDPTLPDQATRKSYVDQKDALLLPLAGGTLTGPLVLDGYVGGLPTLDLQAATKRYVDNRIPTAADVTGKVDKAGDIMTGFLTLHASPSATDHATSKQYVDSESPATAKAWANVKFNEVAPDAANAILSVNSHNIASITYRSHIFNGHAVFRVTFATPFTSDAYCVSLTGLPHVSADTVWPAVGGLTVNTKSTTFIDFFVTLNNGTPNTIDFREVNLLFFN